MKVSRRLSLVVALTSLAVFAGAASAQRYAYICNTNQFGPNPANSVSVIDTTTDTIVATEPVGSFPWGAAVGEDGDGWIVNALDDTVSRIDAGTFAVTATIPVGDLPSWAALGADGHIWVPNNRDDTLSRIDPSTNTVVATVPASEDLWCVAVGLDGHLWTGSGADGTAMRIDPTTNSVVATVPAGSSCAGLVVGADGHVWVMARLDDTVHRIDPATNTVVASVTVGNLPWCGAVGPDGHIWICNEFGNSVSRIDPATNTVVATVEEMRQPLGIDLDGNGQVWVIGRAFGEIYRIDPGTNTIAATIPLPAGIAPQCYGQFIRRGVPEPCRLGNVDTGDDTAAVDLVTVNGSSGDLLTRTVHVTANVDTTVHIDQAPTGSGHYGIWIYEGSFQGCNDVSFRTLTLGQANTCLPSNNVIAPGSCPCPTMDFFGQGLVGATSRDFGPATAAKVCVSPSSGFSKAPIDFTINFPPGTYQIFSAHHDRNSTLSPANDFSIGNTIVVVAE